MYQRGSSRDRFLPCSCASRRVLFVPRKEAYRRRQFVLRGSSLYNLHGLAPNALIHPDVRLTATGLAGVSPIAPDQVHLDLTSFVVDGLAGFANRFTQWGFPNKSSGLRASHHAATGRTWSSNSLHFGQSVVKTAIFVPIWCLTSIGAWSQSHCANVFTLTPYRRECSVRWTTRVIRRVGTKMVRVPS